MRISIQNSLCLRLRQEDGNNRYLLMAKILYTDPISNTFKSIWKNVTANKEKGELFCFKEQIQPRAYAFAKYLSTQGDIYEGYVSSSTRTSTKKFDCLEFIALKLLECVSKTEDYEVCCRMGFPMSGVMGISKGKEDKQRLLTSDDLEMFEGLCKENPDDGELIFTRKDIKSPDDIRVVLTHRFFETVDRYFVIDMTPENEFKDKQFMTNRKAFISKAIGTKYPYRALQFINFDEAFEFAQQHMLDFPTQGFDIIQIDKKTDLELFMCSTATNYWGKYWK